MKTKHFLSNLMMALAVVFQLFAPTVVFAAPDMADGGPTVTITSTVSDPTNINPIPVTFTFSEDVTGFDSSDILVGNGVASNFQTDSGSVYTADVTPTADGSVSVDVAADTAINGSMVGNTAAVQFSIVYDSTNPTAVITTSEPDPTNSSPFVATITFDEVVTGFTVDDVDVTNGTKSTFTAVSGSVYTVEITPTADGEVWIDMTVDVAFDAAGNGNDDVAWYTTVNYDGTAPSVDISSTASDPTNVSPIPLTFTFDEDVTGFDVSGITVGNGSADNFQMVSASVYTADITPASDGSVTVDVDADVAADAATNGNTAATQFSVVYDGTAPSVVISTSEADPTPNRTFEATFTFSEDVTDFALSDITVGNGSAGNLQTVSASVYTADITATDAGSVTVDVDAEAAADGAGNGSVVADQFGIVYEPILPIASLIMGLGETATNTSPLIIGASFSQVVTGFELSDLAITNGTAQNFTGSGDAYEFEVVPDAEGIVTIEIPANAAQNTDLNGNTATSLDIDYDITDPSLDITSSASDPTAEAVIPVTFTFDEPVSGFEVTDITVSNGTVDNFQGVSETVYSADVTATAEGSVTVDVFADVASDTAGNYNTSATQFTIDYVGAVPTIVVISTSSNPTGDSPIPVTFTFSEAVTGFELSDIIVGNGTASNFVAVSSTVYTADVTPTTIGEVTVDVPADAALDSSSNGNLAADQFSITFDPASPTVVITSVVSDPTNASPFGVTFTFSEAVTGFAIGDITVGNGTASNFMTVSSTVYTADITPTGDGTVTIDVAADVAVDTFANGNLAADQFSLLYDGTRPTVIVSSVQSTPTNDSPITITVEFSEDVTGLGASDFTISNGTIGALSGSGSSYTLEVTPSDSGYVTVTLGDEQCQDAAGNRCQGSEPYTIEYDLTRPSVVITNPSDGQITFTFSESVSGFLVGDISISGGTLSNFAGSGTSYTVDVAPSIATVTISVPADVAVDAAGNTNTASNLFEYIADNTSPSLLGINRLDANPTKATSVRFSVTFSEPVDGLDNGDLALAQTGVTGAAITSISGSGSIYTVTVSTGTGSGTIELRLSTANNIQDLSGNPLAAITATSEAYSIDRSPVTLSASTMQLNLLQTAASLTVQFSEDVYNPAGDTDTDDVTNPNNFLLLQTGTDGVYNTTTCAAGVSLNDIRVPVNSVNYNNTTFTATLNLNNGVPLAPGNYRLIVCGTTSVTDLAGNSLNGGNDVTLDLVVWDRIGTQPHPIPVTGFASTSAMPNGQVAAYQPTGATLSISSIGLNTEMVSVPFTNNDWDITWLGDKVGVLVGMNDLDQPGNTVITGHNWDYDDTPGPFLKLTDVAVGEKISIAISEGIFTFTVVENKVVDQYDLDSVFYAADQPTITLVTCDGYDAYSMTFTQRRIIRAVIQ